MSIILKRKAEALLAQEQGTIRKDWGGRCRFDLVYPNSYAVGMSNLGFQAIYRHLNQIPDVVCERVFFPDPADLEEHRRTRTPPLSLESGRPLADFHLVGFSITYEGDFINTLRLLGMAGVPLRPADRAPHDPLILMGGVCAFSNPEPVAPFMDVVVVGEGEELVREIVECWREVGTDRAALLGRRGPSPEPGVLARVRREARPGVPARRARRRLRLRLSVDWRSDEGAERVRRRGVDLVLARGQPHRGPGGGAAAGGAPDAHDRPRGGHGAASARDPQGDLGRAALHGLRPRAPVRHPESQVLLHDRAAHRDPGGRGGDRGPRGPAPGAAPGPGPVREAVRPADALGVFLRAKAVDTVSVGALRRRGVAPGKARDHQGRHATVLQRPRPPREPARGRAPGPPGPRRPPGGRLSRAA